GARAHCPIAQDPVRNRQTGDGAGGTAHGSGTIASRRHRVGQGRRRGARPLSAEGFDGRFWHTNFQYYLRPVDGARGATASTATHPAGPLRPTATAEADERVAVRQLRSYRTRSGW